MSKSRISNKQIATDVIWLVAQAPDKPAFGAPCNGCGACCAAEPCPVSRFWLRHREGSCPALEWSEAEQRYWCGMVAHPGRYVPRMPKRLEPLIRRWTRRWIASGIGCDFDAEVA